VDKATTKIHYVRKVAPNKDMFCISFKLPRDVAVMEVGGLKRSVDVDENVAQPDSLDSSKRPKSE
jgi:tRNA (guanine37-N1)-methyltransferase